MIKLINTLLLCCLMIVSNTASATTSASIKPFSATSMQEILAARQGKPFILGLWSLSCTHCRDDLALLSSLSQQHPELDLVLIATDSLDEADDAVKTIARLPFANMQHWIFADDFTEQLRYSIDQGWHGELPRTCFYDAAHQMRAISGKLDATATERWIKEQYRR
jgi:thiol-disulfide isomerase/thioredoxin